MKEQHTHTDECWEPDSGCDMGRNEKYVRSSNDVVKRAREQLAHYNHAYKDAVEPLIAEIERLTNIVKALSASAKPMGYECPDCHQQIAFGDSICRATLRQHAAPAVEVKP